MTAPAATTSQDVKSRAQHEWTDRNGEQWRVDDEPTRVRQKNGPGGRVGRCRDADRVRGDPALRSALHRAAAGGGRVRDAAGGHGRTAAAPGGAATLPAREAHQGRQGCVYLCRSWRVPQTVP